MRFLIDMIELRYAFCIRLNLWCSLYSPIDFFRHDRNRFAHAAAFGATAGACLQIFEKKFFLFGINVHSSSWLQS